MGTRVRVSDLDFVYISYKEPNKEENWADLLSKVPWAKRVDGVVGFDSAHKAAAEKAETDFFISVDGDNIIDESFLLQTLDWTKTNPKAVHRWRAKNNVNGLVYGNGGLVGWDKETCLQMKTHENADNEKAQIDFCWTKSVQQKKPSTLLSNKKIVDHFVQQIVKQKFCPTKSSTLLSNKKNRWTKPSTIFL